MDEDTLYDLSLKIEPRLPAWTTTSVPGSFHLDVLLTLGMFWRHDAYLAFEKEGGKMSIWTRGKVEGPWRRVLNSAHHHHVTSRMTFIRKEGHCRRSGVLSEFQGLADGLSLNCEESGWRYVACTEVELLARSYVVYCGPSSLWPLAHPLIGNGSDFVHELDCGFAVRFASTLHSTCCSIWLHRTKRPPENLMCQSSKQRECIVAFKKTVTRCP